MSNGIKAVIGILFVLVAGCAFVVLSLWSQLEDTKTSKTALENQLTQYKDKEQRLTQDNQKLSDQIKEAQGIQAKLQNQVTELNSKLTSLTVERDDWKSKIDELRKERDDLVKKLQEAPQPAPAAVARETEEPAVPTQDEYWAGVLKEKAALELQLAELQTTLNSGSVEVGEMQKKNTELDLELTRLKNEYQDIERKLKYSEDLANTLSIQLAQEKNDKRKVSESFEKISEENLSLRAQVKELMTVKVALEKSMAKLSSDKDTVEKNLSMTESMIQSRIDEVLDIKKTLDKKLQTEPASKEIELPPIIVSAPAPGTNVSVPSKTGFNGRVISINPDNNFIVVDLGENSGVRVGDTLSVYRGSKLISNVDVIQVRKDISAADIRQKGAKIEVGDSVR